MLFVDTSGLFAYLDADDRFHASAEKAWNALIDTDEDLLTTNYVVLETAALVQRRIGLSAVRSLHNVLVPALTVEWIGEREHAVGMEAAMAADRRALSVVDCISFHVMRRKRLSEVFAFDAHFRDQGFTLIPSLK